jgi:hypothetical protein
MAGVLNGISTLVTGSPITNPGNAQAQNNLGVAEQATNTASSNISQVGQQLLSALQGYASQPNPALSGAYAPVSQNPAASATVSAPQVGSVYSGFNPGAVPKVTGGGVTTPSVAPTYASVLNGAVPTATQAATAAKSAAPATSTTTPAGLPTGYNWSAFPGKPGDYIATDPNNPDEQVTYNTANKQYDISNPYYGVFGPDASTFAGAVADYANQYPTDTGKPASSATSKSKAA